MAKLEQLRADYARMLQESVGLRSQRLVEALAHVCRRGHREAALA